VHEPVRAALPDFANMSEDELLAYVQQQESGDQYTIPYGIEPDGMSYQWKRHEVYGKPDYANMSDLEQKGWRAVPQSRHDGRWMPPGTSGPTLRDGLMLMEIPTPLLRAKETMRNRSAVQQVDSMTERLSYTAPGAAPRTAHPKTMPVVRREMVQIEVAP
jgi:hypothetical protein